MEQKTNQQNGSWVKNQETVVKFSDLLPAVFLLTILPRGCLALGKGELIIVQEGRETICSISEV